MEKELTHIDEQGDARMVDVSDKAETKRMAVACGFISMQASTYETITSGTAKKGDVLAAARIAGIMAAKNASNLIPLCHPLALSKIEVKCEPIMSDEKCGIEVTATCALTGKTGVEIEAITAASIALITIYDMCKAIDRGMVIEKIRLLHKSGGKSGTWDFN